MRRAAPVLVVATIAVIAVLVRAPAQLPGAGADAPGAPPEAVPAGARPAVVTAVVDGDTLRVDVAGRNERVRLLALDAPEVSADCGAAAATSALAALAPTGSQVWLESDVEDRDRYDRLLRYVWRDDGALVNVELVTQGWVRARLYPPNDRHWPRLRRAEQRARAAGAGLWTQCPP